MYDDDHDDDRDALQAAAHHDAEIWRQIELEEAFQRARRGEGSPRDWETLRAAAGIRAE